METEAYVVNNSASTEIKRNVAKVDDDWLGRTELMIIKIQLHQAPGRLARA